PPCLPVFAVGLLAAPAVAADRPNVVIILSDDQGYADAGFQGSKEIPTPHLDALAKTGVRCTSGYVSHPFCSPTRAGLMTGRYQQRFGHENNPTYDPTNATLGLPLDQTTLADVLKKAGYATGAVGKWHLGATPAHHPLARGFGEFFGFLGGGHDYFRHNVFQTNPAQARAEYRIALQRNREQVPEDEYLTDALGREACAFVERHKAEPFFLYLAFNAPHTPLQAPSKYLDRVKGIADEKRRTYAAMVCGLDDAVGRRTAKLHDRGLEENTLVVFLSDNGGQTQVSASRNDPLRGLKGQVYEGGIRVPFVVRWPAKLPGGTTYDEPVCSIDLFPTACAAGGVAVSAGLKLDGVDLLPYLAGRTKGRPHERLFWRAGGGKTYAVRQGRYKLAKEGAAEELFDVVADIGETKDLAAAKPEVLAELLAAYRAWNAELVPPKWENPRPRR
ncbi:MAG TPA: sulfatase, partial [Gemmataceae bacterium]